MMSFSRLQQRASSIIAFLGLILAGLLLFTACGRDEAKTIRVPKENTASANPHGDMTGASPHGDMSAMGAHGQGMNLPRVEYTAPPDWQEMPLGGMRVAYFNIKKGDQEAEVSVVPLPGAMAASSAIVNMWREQLKLKPATDSDVPKAEKVTVGPAEGQLYDLSGTELDAQKRKLAIVGALATQDQTMWVLKMLGHSDLVHEQKPAFISFLKSIKFTAPKPAADPHAGMAMGKASPGTPGMAATESTTPKPTWSVPANWKEQPATTMLLAKFVVSGSDSGQTEITVSSFPGDVGGMLANVNRWRAQIGLPAIQEADLGKETSSIDLADGKATLVDLAGTNPRSGQKARMIGAVVPRGGQTWFYKMLGDEQLTAREKEAFIKFVQSVRYPNAG